MSLALKYSMNRKKKCMAKGGDVNDKPALGLHDSEHPMKGVHKTYSVGNAPYNDRGVSMAGSAVRQKHQWGTQEHRRVLNQLKGMKSPKLPMAEGGDVNPE